MRAVRLKAGLFTFGMLATSVATASVGLAAPADSAIAAQDLTNVSTNRVVVYHSPFVQPSSKALAAATHSRAQVLRRYSVTSAVVSLGESLSGDALAAAMEAIDATPGVIKVEPSIRMKAFDVTPNDPYLPDPDGQWYIPKTATHSGSANLAPAWSLTKGHANTVVAVLDTGYTVHEDFDESRIVAQADFVGADEPGVFVSANDGDGWDTDASDPGDSISPTDSSYFDSLGLDCPTSDSSWHGTHVSGIIAASSNNGTGVVGIDWNTKLVQVRVLGECGGADSEIADGIRWAAGLHVDGMADNPYPADVINMSLGGPGSCQSFTQDAIDDVHTNTDAIIVVAAGNSNVDTQGISPANCDDVITVGATDITGMRADFGGGEGSNYGSEVDLMAPGDSILNIINVGLEGPEEPPIGELPYAYLSGTSMATPVVSAIISLMQGQLKAAGRNVLSQSQMETRLKQTTRPFTAGTASQMFSCKNTNYPCGAGMVDAFRALWTVTAPKVIVYRNDMKISLTKTSAVHHFNIQRGGSTIKTSVTTTSYLDAGKALRAGALSYSVLAYSADGSFVASLATPFNVQIPVKPTISVTGGTSALTVNATLPANTPAFKTWCVYVDNVLKKCVAAGTRSTTIAATKGTHSVYVRASTLKGTSPASTSATTTVR